VLELAYRTRDNRPDCSVFWVPAASVENIQQAYLEISRQLQIQTEKKEDVIKLLQDTLSQDSAGQWLLIFDNADDIDMWLDTIDISPRSTRLIDCLPRSNKGSIVFTTRTRKAAVKFAPAILHVPEKDEDVATQILKNSLNNQEILNDDPAVWDFLSKLAFLPLAIVQAAAYINENDISLWEYLSLWDDTEENIIEVLSEDFEDEGRYRNQKNPVATTWLISFEQIQQRDALAAEYLSFMSCLDPKMIPESLLPPGQNKKKALDAIGTLTAYSFITKQQDRTFDLHRLVHLATRSWLKEQGSSNEWIKKAIARLADVFPDNDHQNRALWRAYLPHARCLLSSSLKDDVDGRLLLLERFGLCLMSDGRYIEAEGPFTQVMEARKRVLGPEHPSSLTSMANLASTYWNQGRWQEAEELHTQVMEARKRVLGPEHPSSLSSMANLAATYWNQGRWQEAEELHTQVMEARKRVLGPEHPDSLTSMANLATTYRDQGRWQEAEELQVQVMEARKRVLGPEHPSSLSSMASLAATYRNQGRWQEAEELEVQVMEARKRVLGPEHPSSLTGMANLATTYWNQGRWQEAEELQVQVMEATKRVLGPEHPDSLTSMASLAATYWNQGRWQEAEELEVQVMEARKRVLGPEHPSSLTGMANLAATYWNQERWQEAEELQTQVMEATKRVLGPEHPDSLTSMANLAYTWNSYGRETEALELMEECYQLRKQKLGTDHPDTVSSLDALNRWKLASLSLDT